MRDGHRPCWDSRVISRARLLNLPARLNGRSAVRTSTIDPASILDFRSEWYIILCYTVPISPPLRPAAPTVGPTRHAPRPLAPLPAPHLSLSNLQSNNQQQGIKNQEQAPIFNNHPVPFLKRISRQKPDYGVNGLRGSCLEIPPARSQQACPGILSPFEH